MKLKVKISKFSAGRPIAILNEETAKELNLSVDSRVLVKSKKGELITLIDISEKLARKNEIVLSEEAINFLRLKGTEKVEIEFAKRHKVLPIIHKKLKGKQLSEKEIYKIIDAITKNALTEGEIAFFISAVYSQGMSPDETFAMTKAMFKTGRKLKLKNKIIVDKHSIGGIAGNRTTPLVVSICAAAGLTVPKNSSRAITSAAGTADTMETICNVDFRLGEVKKIIKKTGACMVHGGSLGFAPADAKIIRVEKLISIDPLPNLLASIISKKLSVGSKYIVIDIPYGKSAKVNKKQALELKKQFETIGKKFKLKIKVVLTDGSQPIGEGIGPVLELRDILSILKNQGPQDLKDKSIFLAGQIFELCGKSKKGQGENLAKEMLESGKALEKFRQIVKAQGGKENFEKHLTLAKFSKIIRASKNTKIKSIDNKKVNLLARVAGSPSNKKAGVYLHRRVRDKVKKGDKLITIYAQSKEKLKQAVSYYLENKVIA